MFAFLLQLDTACLKHFWVLIERSYSFHWILLLIMSFKKSNIIS